MSSIRLLLAAAVTLLAVILQITLFPHLAWQGVVPNLALLVVVAAGLVRGPQFAMVLGFAAGAIIDLAPPADHLAGRWALALLVVGYLSGRVRQDTTTPALAVVATAGAMSFVGSSIFALTGLILQDPIVDVTEMLQVILIGLAWDVVLAPFVIPMVMRLFRRTERTEAIA